MLVENTPGLFDRGFSEVLGDLAALGFDAEWGVLSACAVGAPHTRARVFIVAYPAGIGCEAFNAPSRLISKDLLEEARRHTWRGDLRRGASGRLRLRPDPDILGVADGFPEGMDRLHGLGNAVVPQVAEWIGHRLMEIA